MTVTPPLYEHDLELTRQNQERLRRNPNLMYWYRELYKKLFSDIPDVADQRILEIGSGTSPLKEFYPGVITSDVLRLDYLDHVFDCHELADYEGVPDQSIDIITLTNVLHHLRDPIHFLQDASRKLARGGQIYMVEPYFSVFSYPLYKLLHHEPVRFGITRPVLDRIEGPLSTSNQAIPFMIFFSRPRWREALADCYDLNQTRLDYFSSLSYMMTGGISRVIPLPSWLYQSVFVLDRILAKSLPRVFASFFIAKLRVQGAG